MRHLLSLAVYVAAAAVAAWPFHPRDEPPAAPPQKFTHLYICVDAGFKGACENEQVDLGKCYNVADNWNDNISSTGPDKGYFCTAYPNYDCNGQAFPFINPGIWDLENYKFNDIISSYRCEELGGLD